MDKRLLTAPLAVALLFGCAARSRAELLVNNPGFESGQLSPWVPGRDFSDGEDWGVTAADAHSGAFAATAVGNKELRQDFAAVPTSEVAEVSFWLRHPQGARIAFVDLFYSDGTDSGFVVSTRTDGWEFFDVTDRLAPDRALSGLGVFGYLELGTTADRTFLDDVTVRTADVVPVPEPSGLALAATGMFAAAVVFRRRRGIGMAPIP